jgi:hypothetical protein
MFRKWTDLGISKYKYRFRSLQTGVINNVEGIVTVSGGRVIEGTLPDSNVLVPEQDLPKYKSIEELFDVLRTEIAAAEVVTVIFDRDLHFPSSMTIDYHHESGDIIIFFEATEFQSL